MQYLKRFVAAGLVVLITVQATGCTSWRTVKQPVPAAVAQHPNRKVLVVYRGGGDIKADSARTDGNTLIVYLPQGADTIPLAEVKEVKVREPNGLKDLGLIVAVAAGLLLGLVIVCIAQDCMYD